MENLKIINDLSEETLNKFYRENLSYESKRFFVIIRKELKPKGYLFNSIQTKDSILKYLQDNNYNDPFIDYIFRNENTNYTEYLNKISDQLIKGIFKLFSTAQTSIDNKAFKKEYFEMQYKTIESLLIELGSTFRTNEKLSGFVNLLKELIDENSNPEVVLHPKEIASIPFLHDMLGKLAKIKFISTDFKNEETQIHWIKRAFNVDFYIKNQMENFQLKINWNNQSRLADWLLFLKEYCVVYEKEDNKTLLDWMVLHVKYKDQDILKNSSVYQNIKRALRKRKKGVSKNMFIDENKLFNYKKNPSF